MIYNYLFAKKESFPTFLLRSLTYLYSVKDIVAADLPPKTTETAGGAIQLSKAVFSSDTRSGESSSGLSQKDDSNMVCEAIRADALVKHIIGQNCQDMGKFSISHIMARQKNRCTGLATVGRNKTTHHLHCCHI